MKPDEFVKKCREWQRENTDFLLSCDVEDIDLLYVQFFELPWEKKRQLKKEYGSRAEALYSNGFKQCKVPKMWLDESLSISYRPLSPLAMVIYKIVDNGIMQISGRWCNDHNYIYDDAAEMIGIKLENKYCQ